MLDLISDVKALNAYGSIVSAYLRSETAKGLCDPEQLTFIINELKEVYGKVTGSPQVPLLSVNEDSILGIDEKISLLRSIDEIRLRMVGVMLGVGLGALSREGTPTLQLDLTRSLVTGKSGAAWGYLERACVILMPATDESGVPTGFADDLLEIYDSMSSSDVWVIDCSSVKMLPLMLVALLLGYRDDLATRSVRIGLVWLAKSSIPETLSARMIKLFDLQEIGEYFFTRSLRS